MDLVLEEGASGQITVWDGERIVPARLSIIGPKGNDYSRTLTQFDHQRYLIEGEQPARYEVGPLPAGKYRVRAQLADGRTAEATLELKLGTIGQLELKF